ncbi:hypothetical protein ACIBI3_02210 [Actinomadura luteofluorescens]|uniref:hypothetical protein n=1 Tax=Actinomadura luteofluorescens TaxID=46163 RepID=UPI0034982BF0
MTEQTTAAHAGHSAPEVAELDAVLADPDGPCPHCLRLLVTTLADARDAARAQVQRVRELHTPDENGECANCRESYEPCSTIRALDGTETL